MISYDNLWIVMKEKGVSQYALIKKHNISPAQITRLKRNESVSTHTNVQRACFCVCVILEMCNFKMCNFSIAFPSPGAWRSYPHRPIIHTNILFKYKIITKNSLSFPTFF